jgi:2,5-dihydroxypyridine 5,6-dioxygenase
MVLNEGDVALPFMRYNSAPVGIVFKDGRVTSIEGGYEARLIREFIESWDDPNGYSISHVGWGLNKQANWAVLALYSHEPLICQDINVFYGNFLLSTGPNEAAGRYTRCHFDLAFRDVTLELDGETILKEGDVVPDLR